MPWRGGDAADVGRRIDEPAVRGHVRDRDQLCARTDRALERDEVELPRTGRGGKAAPALLKWRTLATPGVSDLSNGTSSVILSTSPTKQAHVWLITRRMAPR